MTRRNEEKRMKRHNGGCECRKKNNGMDGENALRDVWTGETNGDENTGHRTKRVNYFICNLKNTVKNQTPTGHQIIMG